MAGIFLFRQAMPIANVTPASPSEVIHCRSNAVCTAAGEASQAGTCHSPAAAARTNTATVTATALRML